MGRRERRGSVDRSMFRRINEEIEAAQGSRARELDVLELICECRNAACSSHIRVTRASFARARADPTTFVVAPGHEERTVDEVVERAATYVVVRASPPPATR